MIPRTGIQRSLLWASSGAPLAPPPGRPAEAPTEPQRRPEPERARAVEAPAEAPAVAPAEVATVHRAAHTVATGRHPLARTDQSARLFAYDSGVKDAFDRIEPTLRRVAGALGQGDVVTAAQGIARAELGFDLPAPILDRAWVDGLDGRALYAWAVFETARREADRFFADDPLGGRSDPAFDAVLHDCGFHTVDISPCADGRLAHVISQVLRLPYGCVRRRSHAGALFDIEDSVQKWVEVEMHRYREGLPTAAHRPTRYLKVVVYHTSESDPAAQGCAAHKGDTTAAARAGLERLHGFRQAVESGFCCGASIDLLLVGLDTDSDAIRLHIPGRDGRIALDDPLDVRDFHADTRHAGHALGDPEAAAAQWIRERLAARGGAAPEDGMVRFCARLVAGNLSQIDLVAAHHGGRYADIGHAERFIGLGIGFEEIQLRNLTYFAYLHTVEEGAADLDVGVKVLGGLNAPRGLPVPAIVRFDYHGTVPGARDRAIERARRTEAALHARFPDLVAAGRLHTARMVRDCTVPGAALEVDGGTVHDTLTGTTLTGTTLTGTGGRTHA
ncbi:carboxysome shell carbonic anhydrase [Roseospira navarrensis]|uniref:Carboxysome shell carbonic anhydrase n=1 Tax=Roseospira navarrensis TaxID=140058 RepID=A0A7X2D567_9PROT|nr:carboxysome shell carbonic anhydrase [Roseospira navarrensis]MQX37372.1 carboxysome shell carbonic anhydrase [Roseospira navarrensis]